MYFDRTVPSELSSLLNGPLAWLRADVLGSWGQETSAHIQFRKNSSMPGGWLQLYTSNESPLGVQCLQGRKSGGGRFRCFSLQGDSRPAPPKVVRARWPRRGISQPGERLDSSGLQRHSEQLRAYVHEAAHSNPSFDIEGRLTASIARGHGHHRGPEGPFVVLDTESRVGFSNVAERRAFMARLKREGLAHHQELDVLALLPDGRLLLVEVKVHPRDLQLAARQAATYQCQFAAVREAGALSPACIQAWMNAKTSAGLLPGGSIPTPSAAPPVPAIALPDSDSDWVARWREAVAPVRRDHPAELADLRFYRLSPAGDVLDEVVA